MDIAAACETARRNLDSDFTLGLEWESVLISAATLDCRFRESRFRSRYPELWRRARIVGIADFDGSGRKKVLKRRYPFESAHLLLVMLDPSRLRVGEASNAGFLDVSQSLTDGPGVPGYSPIRIVSAGGGVQIEIRHKIRQDRGRSNSRAFFEERINLEFTGRRFNLVSVSKGEIGRAEFDAPVEE
jgi:hypothetical protein